MASQRVVREWMETNPGPHTSREIADGIGVACADVRKTLSRMARWDEIHRTTECNEVIETGVSTVRTYYELKKE